MQLCTKYDVSPGKNALLAIIAVCSNEKESVERVCQRVYTLGLAIRPGMRLDWCVEKLLLKRVNPETQQEAKAMERELRSTVHKSLLSTRFSCFLKPSASLCYALIPAMKSLAKQWLERERRGKEAKLTRALRDDDEGKNSPQGIVAGEFGVK